MIYSSEFVCQLDTNCRDPNQRAAGGGKPMRKAVLRMNVRSEKVTRSCHLHRHYIGRPVNRADLRTPHALAGHAGQPAKSSRGRLRASSSRPWRPRTNAPDWRAFQPGIEV